MEVKKEIHSMLSTINDNIISNLIFTFIKEKQISYSENKNGIFFNISLLDDILAKELLDYIIKLVKTNNYNKIEEIIVPENIKVKEKEKKIKKTNYKDYDLDNLESIILKFSLT